MISIKQLHYILNLSKLLLLHDAIDIAVTYQHVGRMCHITSYCALLTSFCGSVVEHRSA